MRNKLAFKSVGVTIRHSKWDPQFIQKKKNKVSLVGWFVALRKGNVRRFNLFFFVFVVIFFNLMPGALHYKDNIFYTTVPVE